MAITLLRRQSDVPTVQGQDDSRMMRYAVVHDGVTRGYQSECGYSISGSTFTVLGGEVIVDGWQAIIDSLGCAVQAISSSTKMYYIVYVEYDLRISDQQSVTIKSTYASGAFPEITPGDDLTENPNGLRRFALYRFTIQNGTISGVERLFSYCEVGDSKNVTTSINGKAITSIFETDGTTAKKATHASADANGNPLLATDPAKLEIMVDGIPGNGWTEALASERLPAAGIYLVCARNSNYAMTSIGIIIYDGNNEATSILSCWSSSKGYYNVHLINNSSGFSVFEEGPDGEEWTMTGPARIYYKRIV